MARKFEMNKNPLMTAGAAALQVQKAVLLLGGKAMVPAVKQSFTQPQRLAITISDLEPQRVNIRHTIQNLDTPAYSCSSLQSPIS